MKTKITLLILSLLLISCQKIEKISYPEYYRNFNKVNEHLNAGEVEVAIAKFENLRDQVPHLPAHHLFKVARICGENNLCDLSAKYLEQSLRNGREYGKGLGSNKTIDQCPDQIKVVLDLESEIHQQNFNFQYKAQIDSMFKADQKARMESDYTSMRIIDSLNMFTLLGQIEKWGFPSEKIIGAKSASSAFILLLHMDRDKNNQVFKPIIEKAFNEGLLAPRSYAWIIDRRRAWGEDELEPYYYHMPSKKLDSFNLEQINEINRRRDSIGLEPL